MGTKCKVCKEGEIVERDGKYGKFYPCNGYPKCKAVYNKDEDGKFTLKEKKVVKTTGKKCPDCEKNGRDGELIERKNKSSGNSFYGCSKYPTCKFSSPLEGDEGKKYSKPKRSVEPEDTDEAPTENNDDDDLNLDVG